MNRVVYEFLLRLKSSNLEGISLIMQDVYMEVKQQDILRGNNSFHLTVKLSKTESKQFKIASGSPGK